MVLLLGSSCYLRIILIHNEVSRVEALALSVTGMVKLCIEV